MLCASDNEALNELPLSRERRVRCSLYLDRLAARRLQRPVRRWWFM